MRKIEEQYSSGWSNFKCAVWVWSPKTNGVALESEVYLGISVVLVSPGWQISRKTTRLRLLEVAHQKFG